MAKLVMIGMLISGGSSALANLPSGGGTFESKLVTIHSRAAKINDEFPGFNLRVRENITTDSIADGTLLDLRDLDIVLHDESIVPNRKLINLACPRAYCFKD